MNGWKPKPFRSWRTAARYGAAVGYLNALVYGAVTTLYIIFRSSAQVLGILSPAEGLWRTLATNAFSILWPCLVTTFLLGLLAAVIGLATFLMIYGLSLALNGRKSPTRMAAIGLIVAASLALLVNFLVVDGLSAYWGAFWPQGYLFWLGLPSLIFVGTTTWLCWQQEVQRISRSAKLSEAVAGS